MFQQLTDICRTAYSFVFVVNHQESIEILTPALLHVLNLTESNHPIYMADLLHPSTVNILRDRLKSAISTKQECMAIQFCPHLNIELPLAMWLSEIEDQAEKKLILYGNPIAPEHQEQYQVYQQKIRNIKDQHKRYQLIEGYFSKEQQFLQEKELEQQIHQSDKLASLGQLVSGIGHEINNPNQFIKGNISIIKEAVQDMLPITDEHFQTHPDLKIARLPYTMFKDHILTLINDVANGSTRIKNIVESLRRFARRDEGTLNDTIDINNVINESLRLVSNQVNTTANIHIELDNNLPSILGNAQRIEQVIINLLMNASQAIPKGKKGNIWIKTENTQNFINITVKDDGIGMSDKTIKQIFDPFFTTKRAKGGTGIGLSIVFRIIEDHKGTIHVDSKEGIGSTFTVHLPHQAYPKKAL